MAAGLRTLARNRLVRTVAVLMSGTAVAQLITLVLSPILSRQFTPDAFGVLGLFMALAVLLGTAAPLAYPLAIVVPTDESEARALTAVALLATGATTLTVALLVATAGERIAATFGSPGLAAVLPWLPLAVMADGVVRTLTFAALRARRPRQVSAARIAHSGATGALQLGLGATALAPQALPLGYATGHAISALFLIWPAWRDRVRPTFAAVRPLALLASARRYGNFPRFKLPSQLLAVLGNTATVVVLALLFPAGVVGAYALTRRVVRAPAELVATTLGDAFFARFGELWPTDPQRARRIWWRTTAALVLIVVPGVTLFAWLAPPTFAWVFGDPWREAGHYARWLALHIGAAMVARPAMMALSVVGRQRAELGFAVGRLAAMLGALVVSAPGGPLAAIAAYALAGVTINVAMLAFTGQALARSDGGQWYAPRENREVAGEVTDPRARRRR